MKNQIPTNCFPFVANYSQYKPQFYHVPQYHQFLYPNPTYVNSLNYQFNSGLVTTSVKQKIQNPVSDKQAAERIMSTISRLIKQDLESMQTSSKSSSQSNSRNNRQRKYSRQRSRDDRKQVVKQHKKKQFQSHKTNQNKDWLCSKCHSSNFMKRKQCRKCSSYRDHDTVTTHYSKKVKVYQRS